MKDKPASAVEVVYMSVVSDLKLSIVTAYSQTIFLDRALIGAPRRVMYLEKTSL